MPAGEQEWQVVGIFEDNPLVFSPVLTTTQTLSRPASPTRTTTS